MMSDVDEKGGDATAHAKAAEAVKTGAAPAADATLDAKTDAAASDAAPHEADANTEAPTVSDSPPPAEKTAAPEPKIEPPSAGGAPDVQPELIGTTKPATPQPPPRADAESSFFRRRATLQSANQTLQPQAPPAPPPKKKRRDGALSAMSGFLSFLLVVMVAGSMALVAVMHKLKEPGPLASEKIIYIPPRADLPEILAQLQREGVIDSQVLMNFALLVEGAWGKIKQGEYLFKRAVSLREVMDELIAGRQVMHAVTIPEGLSSEQVVQRLRDNDILAGEVVDTPKEGALLPETYKVARNFQRATLIALMQKDQRKLVESIWAKRAADLPLKTPYELVTLASIVEKETGRPDERPRVAAVFVNRLRKGMRLQSDPTIVYGIVGGKASLGRAIMRPEIEKWTPYNTYAIDGLPPGPIANPGRAALEAAANPAHTRDLYFVADGTGGHVFAETLDQHSRNVQQWRQIEKDQKDKNGVGADQTAPGAPPPPAPPKPGKRGAAPIGRLMNFAARHEDFSPGHAMAEDDGATHRLGKFAFEEFAFFLGGLEDPTADNARHLAALRLARPFFTEEAAQPRAATRFDPALLAAGAAAPDGEGDEPPAMARESADGHALPDGGDDIAAYPVSPARRAEQKARAAKLGLSAGSDQLPTDAIGATAVEEQSPPANALVAAPQPARPRAFDASEGTALDPLRDKTWDLTSTKTVPAGASFR